MEAQTVLWWFALGAILCNVATLILLVRWLFFRTPQLVALTSSEPFSSPSPAALFMHWLHQHALKFAAFFTTAATVGSLYLSEVAHLLPCRYCWFQRTAMYPLALVLVVALISDWVGKPVAVRRFLYPMAIIGLVFAVWHYLVQRFPDWEGGGSCDPFNPCTLTLTWKFRFVSIPYMAGSIFALVLVLLLISWRSHARRS